MMDSRQDQAWPVQVRWQLGAGGTGEVVWRCDALRAGRLYQSSLFSTREEAEQFVMRMQEMEPDQVFNVEAIKASAVWN